ncbi:MAG: hypothetical protein ACERJ2_01010 [Filomicrobium sp.]
MKTILSIIAAASVLAVTSSAQADFAADFFDQQQAYGEIVDRDAVRSGQTLDPGGFLAADAE